MKNGLLIIIITINVLFGQTPKQLNQVKKMVKSTGMTKEQAKSAAKAQGFTGEEKKVAGTQKENLPKSSDAFLKEKANNAIDESGLNKSNIVQEEKSSQEKLEQADETKQVEKGTKTTNIDDELPIIGEEDLELVDEKDLDLESEAQPNRRPPTYFGYDIFKRDPALFQATSVGAVDPDYLIGPGDELIVMLWGETQFRQVLTVDREGFVFIPEIGQVFVNGLNLNLLESKLFRVLSKSYSSLNPQGRKPTTFLDVSLGNLRPLRIQVLGEVSQPGGYTVSPSATLFSALYYFNGPTTLGSLRDIRLIRNGKEIASIDFYDYLLTGKKPQDQKLQLDDVIFIPKRLKTVTIEGEINRPGIFELKSGEKLKDLISIAGNLKITAYLDRAQIDRIVPFDKRDEIGMDRMFTDVNLEEILKAEKDFLLDDGDHIQVFSVLDLRKNVVDIRGAVTRPGNYDLGESLRLSDLIQKADGLLGDAYLERVDIVRVKPDFTEKLIKLNLIKALENEINNDIELQGLDRVQIYSLSEMVAKNYVSISGHVKQSGRFLLQENMTLYDLLFKAGGFIDDEYKKLTYLDRAELIRTMEDSDEREIIPFNLGKVLDKQGLANIDLRANDAVRVYSINEIEGETRYVSISGHVKRPGRYELYEGNMSLYDLIFKAGGFVDEEFKKRTYLQRAELVRIKENTDEKEIIPFNLGRVLNKEDIADTALRTDDAVRVYSINEIEGEIHYVSISGHVKRAGRYELYEGNMKVLDLLFKAGGFDDPQHRASAFLDRADLIRYNKNNITQTIIPFHLGQVLANEKSKQNFNLLPGDAIRVYSQEVFNTVRSVFIEGSVRESGSYTMKTGMTVKDLILEAGGVSEDVFRYKIEIARVDPKKLNDQLFAEVIELDMYSDYTIRNIQYSYDPNPGGVSVERTGGFILKPFDNIFVRADPYFRLQRKVHVLGAVYYPGTYALLGPGETITDILERAGGLRPKAYAEASELIRKNNKIRIQLNKLIKRPKSKSNVVLQNGDTVFVELKPDMTQILGEVTSPGIYSFVPGKRVNDYIKMAGGYTINAEKNEIWIKFPGGYSRKYRRWISNPKVQDGSIITIGLQEEKEPFDTTEFTKELASIAADLTQVIIFMGLIASQN